MVNVNGERGALSGNDGGDVIERSAERGKGYKRGSCHLVAKALELDSDVKKVDKEGGSFYDCNISLEVAREPVSDSTVILIYGNGESERVAELEFGLKIPPRPKARRVESARQQQVTNGLSHVPDA
ncbi:putative GPI-anchored adhesin-like protein PGA55 [Forsythia ovata]|uniref:GPI-anchored adhesin-like protein PGA55 n=1 Tax=Forsythia ovata TaxID=205694 RepID=A0ABD1W7S0_9LAMI